MPGGCSGDPDEGCGRPFQGGRPFAACLFPSTARTLPRLLTSAQRVGRGGGREGVARLCRGGGAGSCRWVLGVGVIIGVIVVIVIVMICAIINVTVTVWLYVVVDIFICLCRGGGITQTIKR